MDIEQLKLILDTVRSVAETAGMAGVIWVVIHYFVQLATVTVGPICMAMSAVLVIKHITHAATKHNSARAESASANEIEKTKQRQLELDKVKTEVESQRAIAQLVAIAEAAKVSASKYTGIYRDSDVAEIIKKVKA